MNTEVYYTKITTHDTQISLLKTSILSMNIKHQRTPYFEIFSSLNSLDPSFMKQIFSFKLTDRLVTKKHKLNLVIPSHNQESSEVSTGGVL